MIISSLILIFIAIILFSLGDILLGFYEKYILKMNIKQGYNALDISLLGLFVLTLITSIISFFLPINTYTLVFIALPIIFYFFKKIIKKNNCIKKYKHEEKINLIFVFIIILFLVLNFSFIIHTYDTKFYHLQQIESIIRFPIIKGLANLEDRYGFNSNSFLIHALFSLKDILGYHFFILNGFLFIALFIFLLRNIQKEANCFNISAFVVFIFIYSTSKQLLNSPNTDITVTMIAYYFVVRILQHKNNLCPFSLFIFCIPCLLITIKLSSSILILFILIPLFYLHRLKKYKTVYILSTTCGIFICTWLFRNIFISGYLIYPYPEIDLFDVDWKVPQTVALIQKEYIRDFAYLVFNTNEKVFIYKLKSFLLDKQYIDFLQLAIDSFFKLLILATPITIIYLIKRKDKITLFITIIISIGCLFCFYQAPYFRFCLPFASGLIFINILSISSIIKTISKRALISNEKTIKRILVYGSITSFIILSLMYLQPNIIGLWYNKNLEIFSRPQLDINCIKNYTGVKKDNINNFNVYIRSDIPYGLELFTQDYFPLSSYTGIPYTNPAYGFKIQHLITIEQIGDSIYEGFRTKDYWKIFFQEKQDSLILDYRDGFKRRFRL